MSASALIPKGKTLGPENSEDRPVPSRGLAQCTEFACALALGAIVFATVAFGLTPPQQSSIEKLQLRVNEAPSDAMAHFRLGVALYHEGRLDAAANEFRTTLKLSPNLAEAHNDLGTILRQQGRVQEAIQEFRTALKLKAQFLGARYNLILALVSNNQTALARTEAQETVTQNPDWPPGYYAVGFTLEKLGSFDAAERALRRALELDARMSQAWYELGVIAVRRGHVDESVQ